MIFSKDHKDNPKKPLTMGTGNGFLQGSLLVATPLIQESCFAKSVILVCDHTKDGGMGLITNRHLRNIDQKDLFTRLGLEKPEGSEVELPVYFGGPVETTRGFVVHSDEYSTKNTVKMGSGVAVTSEYQVLKDYINDEGPKSLMLVMGYSGWANGQLDKEVEENSWIAVPADRELVFDTHDDSKWQKSALKYGIDINRINQASGNA